MASYVERSILSETCEFVALLLRSPLSNSVYTRFASAAFEDLAALCELALPPPSTSDGRVELQYEDKCAVVQLMQTVASCGELSGDSITLALLRLIWSCSSSDEMQQIKQPAQALLLCMGVTKDNFFHVLPKHSQPIAADAQCYLEDQCCADEQSLDYQVDCRVHLLISIISDVRCSLCAVTWGTSAACWNGFSPMENGKAHAPCVSLYVYELSLQP
jgi:hypothetical protein